MRTSKAVAAGLSGAVAGAGTSLTFLPAGSPWYAYVMMTLVTTVLPTVVTYMAPRNSE